MSNTTLERLRNLLFEKRPKPAPDPRVVYDDALSERTAHYEELKQAAAGVLYLRNKLEGELRERRAEIARLHHELRNTVRAGDERGALELIARKHALNEELERTERELDDVRREARDAKDQLARHQEELRALEREKLRAMTTLSSAKARARMEAAREPRVVEVGELERVREHIAKLAMERSLDRELAGGELEAGPSLTAQAELEELKRQLRAKLAVA